VWGLLYCVPEQRVNNTLSRKAPAAPRHWRGLVWWAISFVVIALGYVDLARGGETLAPILLIAGYCVFVPIAILR
jgi:hypothetical protein